MASVMLHTYRDAIDHLREWAHALPLAAEDNRLHRAVLDAYEDLVSTCRWRFFTSHYRITLTEPQSEGTVSVTASTRTATLSGATVPTWARYAHVLFGDDSNVYKVSERVSDTQFTLEPDFCPAEDVAEGTSYVMFRSVYPLPADMLGIEGIEDEKGQWRTAYMPSLQEWLYRERQLTFSGRPFYWTIAGHPDLYGQQAVFLAGYPTAASTLDIVYNRAPRELVHDGFSRYSSQGSARLSTAAAGSTTATFTGLAVTDDVVGAVLRLSRSGASEPPTRLGVNRYTEQRVITSVTQQDPAQLLVDSTWTTGKLGDHFTISDPLDLPRYMLDALYRGAEYYLAAMSMPERVAEAYSRFRQAKRRARAVDGRGPQPLSAGGFQDEAWKLAYGVIYIGGRSA